jgi:hypothetical protein
MSDEKQSPIVLSSIYFNQFPKLSLNFIIDKYSQGLVEGVCINVINENKKSELNPSFIHKLFKPQLFVNTKKNNTTDLNIQPFPNKFLITQRVSKSGKVSFVPTYKINGKFHKVIKIMVDVQMDPLKVLFNIVTSFKASKYSETNLHIETVQAPDVFATNLKNMILNK